MPSRSLPHDFTLAWVSCDPKRSAFVCASPDRYRTLAATVAQLAQTRHRVVKLDSPDFIPLVTRHPAPSPLRTLTFRLTDAATADVCRTTEHDVRIDLPEPMITLVVTMLTTSATASYDGVVGPRRFHLEFLPDPRLPPPRGRP